MMGSSVAATRSCSPELGLTRCPMRGLLEAALQHVAAFQEIRRPARLRFSAAYRIAVACKASQRLSMPHASNAYSIKPQW